MASRSSHAIAAAVLVLALACAGCTGMGPLSPASPHEAYSSMLRRAGVDRTALGQDWLRSADAALETTLVVRPPFAERGYFAPDSATAVGYRLELQRGRRLSVEVSVESSNPMRLFVDLFEISGEKSSRRVASLDDGETVLVHDVQRDGSYVLRLQPELLRGGRFAVTQRTLASLRFPVDKADTRTVQSLFGAERDRGAREHEGIDIFVPRGTPVVAVTSGVARPSANTLGGNVVWLRETVGSTTFYYAHLERAAIEGLTYVRAGDVLGFVGNTGNAHRTTPHLHFGIYERGAIDPLPFLRPDDASPESPAALNAWLGTLVRTLAPRIPLRTGSATSARATTVLARYTVAQVRGATARMLRVSLPDGSAGYLAADAIASADAPLRREQLAERIALHEHPAAESLIVEELAAGSRVDVLGGFGRYQLLRSPSGRAGWHYR